MSNNRLSQLSLGELEARLRNARTIQYTVVGIFTLLILAWVVLGYWTQNPTGFIVTIVMGAGAGIGASLTPLAVAAELRKRRATGEPDAVGR